MSLEAVVGGEKTWHVEHGDALDVIRRIPGGSVRCVVSSPPYWNLRRYGSDGELGAERTPGEYVERLVCVVDRLKEVLSGDGTVWLNLGDTFLDKRLCCIPWKVGIALQERSWYLRLPIIWHKPNGKPESVEDRPVLNHEYVLLLSRSPDYWYDVDATREPHATGHRKDKWEGRTHQGKGAPVDDGRASGLTRAYTLHPLGKNRRSVWTIPTVPSDIPHFAVMPEALAEPCVRAGSQEGDLVLDPFCGSGTVGVVARRLGRRFLGIDLSGEYAALSRKRIYEDMPLFN